MRLNWFLENKQKDSGKNVILTTKNLEDYLNLADKEVAGFESTTALLKDVLLRV